MNNSKLAFALLIPLITLFGIILKTEVDVQQSVKIRVPIAGYDPRDLLKGHYLEFRYKWDFDTYKTTSFFNRKINSYPSMEEALCISEDLRKVYPISLNATDSNCRFRIAGRLVKGSGENFDFLIGIEKFYIPEEHAKFLEKKLGEGKGEAELAINNQSRAVLVDLIFSGVSWGEIVSSVK